MDLFSPRKKRRTIEPTDTDTFTTPKKLRSDRLLSRTNPSSSSLNPDSLVFPSPAKSHLPTSVLPPHLARLLSIQSSLQHALSVVLATSAVSPCADTGRVPNVLTHLSLTAAMGFKVSCSVDDIKQLCWLWEWDGSTFNENENGDDSQAQRRRVRVVKPDENEDDDDNPFIDKPPAPTTDSVRHNENDYSNVDWTRGAMGFIVTPTTSFLKAEHRRVPAYGLGIEVEIDLADGKGGGMASVARWTAEGEGRKRMLERKLKSWVEIQRRKENDETRSNSEEQQDISPIPFASIPELVTNSSPTRLSSLTALLTSKSKVTTPLTTPSSRKSSPGTPLSNSKVPFRFPTPAHPNKNTLPFPSTPRTLHRVRSSSPTKSAGLSLLSRSTLAAYQASGSPFESEDDRNGHPSTVLTSISLANASSDSLNSDTGSAPVPFLLQTPMTSRGRIGIQLGENDIATETPKLALVPSTPTSRGTDTRTAATPRRAALLERIRLKSLSSEETPSKKGESGSGSMTREQLRSLGQEEMRRRVLLGRLDEVAATVWAAFASPSQTSSTPLSVARKRRTMRFDEVARAVVSSSRIPISSADAQDSVTLLMDLCPFFLQPLVIEGEEWVEMPASNPNHLMTPSSPRRKNNPEEEVRNRSPKSVRVEAKGGLRDVRERIRREMEDCSI